MPDFIITKDVTGVNAGGSCSSQSHSTIQQLSISWYLYELCLFYVADILRACETSSSWTRQCLCSSSKLCVGIWYQVVLRHMMTTSPNHTIYVAK
jgi:hypothetical protein